MQVDLLSAVRDGRLDRVGALISSYGLSYSEKWEGGYALLCAALKKKRIEVAKLLLINGSKVNIEYNNGSPTPLHYAVTSGHTEIVEILLDRGANTNAKSGSRTTPLHDAVQRDRMEIIKLLLSRGADVNAEKKSGQTSLHIAAEKGHLKIVEHLLKHRAYVNSVYTHSPTERYTPVYLAVINGHEKVVKLLLECGATVDAQDKNGRTILHIAVEKANPLIVEYLLKHGAHINSVHTYFRTKHTPVYDAVLHRYEKIVTLLLQYGANVDTTDTYGKTILQFAVEKGDSVIIQHILKHCPDVNNESNRSAINVAVHGSEKVYGKIVENLLQYGFTVNPKDANNCKLLHTAVRKGYLTIVEDLLKYGNDVNMLDSSTSGNGCTPLHVATKNDQEEVAKLLLRCGANVNAKDETGRTPIFYAVEMNCRDIVEVLLQHGADVKTVDKCGRTPLHFTALNEHVILYEDPLAKDCDINSKGEIARLLLSRGANVNAQDVNGRTVLHAASGKGYVKLFEALLKYNANVNYIDGNYSTPLHVASQSGNLEIVESLLKSGVRVDSKDRRGRTALHFASRKRYLKVVEVLLNFGADVDSKDKRGRTPFHGVFELGCPRRLRFLRELYAVTRKNEYNETPRSLISDKISPEIVTILLKAGASINSKDEHGITALHIAAKMCNLEMVKVLLKFGASIDSKDEYGRTALHIACRKRNIQIVEILLKFGAGIDSKDQYGRTELHIACRKGCKQIVVALLEYGSDITMMDNCNLNYSARYLTDDGIITFYDTYDNDYSDDDDDCPLHHSYPGYGFCNICVSENIAEILKCHIVKVKAANLYASKKDLLSINSDDEHLIDFKNECEKEVASMKSEKVGYADVSFYDILTKGTSQLAVYAGNQRIIRVFRSNDYKRKFLIYATMIYSRFRKGERRNVLMEQGNKIFHFLFTNLRRIPRECTEQIFNYLSDEDLRTVMDAYKRIM